MYLSLHGHCAVLLWNYFLPIFDSHGADWVAHMDSLGMSLNMLTPAAHMDSLLFTNRFSNKKAQLWNR